MVFTMGRLESVSRQILRMELMRAPLMNRLFLRRRNRPATNSEGWRIRHGLIVGKTSRALVEPIFNAGKPRRDSAQPSMGRRLGRLGAGDET